MLVRTESVDMAWLQVEVEVEVEVMGCLGFRSVKGEGLSFSLSQTVSV